MESPFSPDGPSPMPGSLWAATTVRPPPYPILQRELHADVCVIGGGFMGLSAALELARSGKSVVVLEAAEIGWGASGRNNGLVAPGLKRDPWDVRKILGKEQGERLLRFSVEAIDNVFSLVEKLGIDCDANRGGWIQAAHSQRALPLIEKRVAVWQALGAEVEMIPDGEVSEQLGTAFYAGACRYAGGGSINPLAYTVGIAQVASHPLPRDMTANILPGAAAASDTQRLLTSFRLTADNRLITGGASALPWARSNPLGIWLERIPCADAGSSAANRARRRRFS